MSVGRTLIPLLSRRRQLTQDKLLDEPIDHVGCNIDAKGPKAQSRATVLLRIIVCGDGTRGQVSSQAGIVRLPAPVIALADERVAQCVDGARPVCARALVEVARVLMQNRGQNRSADYDIRQPIRIVGPKALAVTLPALLVAGSIRRLIDGCDKNVARNGHGVSHWLQCELKFQLRGE